MALPPNGTVWPPAQLATIRPTMNTWAAWYANDTEALTNAYTGRTGGKQTPSGLFNRVVRFFWTNTRTDLTTQPERKLHVPIASDLAQASADLLFSEPPTVSIEPTGKGADGKPVIDQVTADRLALIAGPMFQRMLPEAAETSAALCGVYFRSTWDTDVAQHAFLTKVDADMAWPEFRYGYLTAVSFWRVVGRDGQTILRHVERHETDAEGIGVILHGLYQGTETDLGRIIPLTENQATAPLADIVDADAMISTGTPGLAVQYAPNITPSRAWRHDPVGANLGRSDFDGIEPLMDALDEAYSSLMRDIRLGKSMLIVPNQMLESNGAGKGASFTQNEVITGVNASPSSQNDSKLAIEEVQFKIRVEEHEQAIMLLFKRIIGSAGYSTQTFGEGGDVAITATEVASKERRSYMTRDRKIRTMQPALEAALSKCLAIDALVFGTGAKALPVSVQFADGVQDDVEALARTTQLLYAAVSASIDTRVRLLHKDWDEEKILAEVELIKVENGVTALADPAALGVSGQGLGGGFGQA